MTITIKLKNMEKGIEKLHKALEQAGMSMSDIGSTRTELRGMAKIAQALGPVFNRQLEQYARAAALGGSYPLCGPHRRPITAGLSDAILVENWPTPAPAPATVDAPAPSVV